MALKNDTTLEDMELEEVISHHAGAVFCFGSAVNGQLGLGGIEQSSIGLPKEIKSLQVY